jgi:hypothetical protein
MRRKSYAWLALGALSIVFVGQAVFAAANTIPSSSAGYASQAVSGYTVSNIDYNLNATTPTNVDTVTFVATSDSGSTAGSVTVYVRFVGGGAWYACARTGGAAPAHNISCDTDAAPGPQLTAAAINTFDASIVEQ